MTNRKVQFTDTLRAALIERGLQLISANLGRGARNLAVWTVTYQDAGADTRLVRVPVESDFEPYAEQTAHSVAAALV